MSFCIISCKLLCVFYFIHAAFVRIKLMMMMMMMIYSVRQKKGTDFLLCASF